jgi:hypothetical protein
LPLTTHTQLPPEKPKIVYAYHYRGQDGFSDIEKFKMLVNKGDASIDVRLKDWYVGNK